MKPVAILTRWTNYRVFFFRLYGRTKCVNGNRLDEVRCPSCEAWEAEQEGTPLAPEPCPKCKERIAMGTKTDHSKDIDFPPNTRMDEHRPSVYAREFDGKNPNWHTHPEYNLLFLRAQQNYANDLLQSRGHVFLNEVYDMLGFDRTGAGAVTGWVIDGAGDGYVDFGTFNAQTTPTETITLDFNVDGVMYDKIEKNS